MSFAAGPAHWNRGIQSGRQRSLAPLAIALLLIPVALAIAEVLYRDPPTWTIAIGGGLLLALAVALVVTRFELAVYIGFLLTSIVLFQPAPSDALFGLIMAVAFVTGRFRLTSVPRIALGLVTAFLLLNVISASAVLNWSVAGSFFFITLYLALFSVWLAGYVDRPARAQKLVRAYLLTAALSAFFATAALYVNFPFHTLLIGDQERAKGLFKDPNVYGPFLVPIALIVAEEIFHPRLLRLRRSLRVMSFLLLVVGVLFSYSRAAWLNLAVGVIVLIAIVVVRRPDRRALSLVMVVIFGALAVAGAVVVTGSLAFLEERAKRQSYDTERFAAQARGVKLGLTHLFGVGPGQFELLSPLATHSLYVRALAEQGILGLLVIAALVLTTLIFGLLNVARGRDTYGISSAALLAAWCGLVANSFFVDTMHWRHLWLVAALIWAGVMRERAGASRPSSLRAEALRTAPFGAAHQNGRPGLAAVRRQL
jgi:O-antigen ligase